MNINYGKVVLITGASSGIGKAIAEELSNKGFKVYGTSRRTPKNEYDEIISPTLNNVGFFRMIQLDVCSEDSISNAVNQVLFYEGKIDILINNAGFGVAGAIEDTTAEEAYSQFNTNFFGPLRMCRNVLPAMRKEGKGLIINISSVAGQVSIPFQSMYSASKYALEALTEALRIEVKPFGINVSMVEPGDIKTEFKRQFSNLSTESSPYHERFTKSVNVMAEDEAKAPGPAVVVKAITKIISMKNPPIRVTAGFSYKLIVLLKRILPSSIVEYLISNVYGFTN